MPFVDPNYFWNLWLTPSWATNTFGGFPPSVPSAEQSANVAAPIAQNSSFGDNTSQGLDDYLPPPFVASAEHTVNVTAPKSQNASSGSSQLSSDDYTNSQINSFVDSIFTRTNPLVSNPSGGGGGGGSSSGNGESSADDSSFGWPQFGQGLATLGGALLGAAPGALDSFFKHQAASKTKPYNYKPFHYEVVPFHPTNFQTYASNHRPVTSGSLAGLDYTRNKRS